MTRQEFQATSLHQLDYGHVGAAPKVIHLVHSVGPAAFGIAPTALQLARAQREVGVEAQVWCASSSQVAEWASRESGLARAGIRQFRGVGPARYGFSPGMKMALREAIDGGLHIIHQHGMWTGAAWSANEARTADEVVTIVTPQGSLDSWARERSKVKKWLGGMLFQNRNLVRASCFHAVSQKEVDDIRGVGLTNPIAVIPNGVASEWLNSEFDANRFINNFALNRHRRTMLFMSRVTPKKGLIMLLRAWVTLRDQLSDWQLVIAGPGEFGHEKEVTRFIRMNLLQEDVYLVGALAGQQKRDAFAAAELFVLPSYSEGAPIVILEALGAGIPVLTTHASPWEDLERFQCGWWQPINEQAIQDGLAQAAGSAPVILKEMGRRGRQLVIERYGWTAIGKMTVELYGWLRGEAPMPAFVAT